MYAYLSGKITEIYQEQVFLEVNNIAYAVNVGKNLQEKWQKELAAGQTLEVKIYTTLIVREDAQMLYGFADRQSKQLFELLLSIPRFGAKLSLAVVDNIKAENLLACVLTQDTKELVKIKGLGAKVAQRLLLELNNKLNKLQAASGDVKITESSHNSGETCDLPSSLREPASDLTTDKLSKSPAKQKYDDLLAALMVLNFSLHESKQMLKLSFRPELTLEENLRLALQTR